MTRPRTPPPPSWGSEQYAALAKAAQRRVREQTQDKVLPPVEEPWGLDGDPFAFDPGVMMGGIRERHDPYGYVATPFELRAVSRMFIAAAVLQTIKTEVVRFAMPQARPNAPGYQLRLRDSKKPPTDAEQKEILRIQRELDFCGVLKNDDERFYRDDLRTYFAKAAIDSLVLDLNPTEYMPDRLGQPARFQAIDGARVRFAKERESGYLYPVFIGKTSLSPLAEWKPGQPHRCHVGIRNTQTTVEWSGYGQSELEMGLQVLYGLAKAMEHNFKWFDHGLSAAGIIALEGSTKPAQVQSLKRMIQATLMGAANNRRVGVLGYEGKPPTWIPFTAATMKDMEFGAFLNFLLKVFCALYKIDPMLIGFQFGNEGQKSTISQGSGKERIDYGRSKGILTIAEHIIEGLDRYYIQPKYPDFEIVCGGLDEESAQDRNARDKEELTFRTLNEVRAGRDDKELDLENETNPANVPQAYLQQWLAMHQAKGTFAPAQPEGGPDDASEEAPEQAGGAEPLDIERFMSEAQREARDGSPVVKSLLAAIEAGKRRGEVVEVEVAA